MDDGFRFFFQASVYEFLTTRFAGDRVDCRSDDRVHKLVRDADQFVIARTPFSDVYRSLLPVVVCAAGTVDQPDLDPILADAVQVGNERRALGRRLDEFLAELSF